MAAETRAELKRMVGSIMVVFSPEINSRHMMALAVKLARGERSELLALYVIEVPLTLPPDAEMPDEERAALDALGAAETIANKQQRDAPHRDHQGSLDQTSRARHRQARKSRI